LLGLQHWPLIQSLAVLRSFSSPLGVLVRETGTSSVRFGAALVVGNRYGELGLRPECW